MGPRYARNDIPAALASLEKSLDDGTYQRGDTDVAIMMQDDEDAGIYDALGAMWAKREAAGKPMPSDPLTEKLSPDPSLGL